MINTKKTLISLVVATGLLFGSCSSDDSSSGSSAGLAGEQNATEESSVPLATLDLGIKIDGAEKITAPAPIPNSDLEFTLESNQEAFQGSGLDINFNAGDDIAGAYIQFKELDGASSNSYFDIPATAFDSEFGGGKKELNSKKSGLRSGKDISQDIDGLDDSESTININFDGVPAGKFCYIICLYNEEGQIYVAQEVCVTVEAWGGNDSIVGEWIFDRTEGDDEDDEDGETSTFCNETEASFSAAFAIEEELVVTFVLNADGTYFETYKGSERRLDFQKSQEQCVAVYNDEKTLQDEKYSGNWAFNEEANTLTVIDFKLEDFINESANIEFEGGELYFEGVTAEIVDGELVLTEGDGEDEVKFFLKRK